VAGTKGLYTVGVESLGHSGPGSYRIEVARLRPASPDDRLRARAVASLAEAHELRRSGSWGDAAVSYRAAAQFWQGLGGRGREADALEWAARCFSHEGREDRAALLLTRAAEGFHAAGEPAQEANSLDKLGTAQRHLGNREEALARYHQALDLWRRLDDRPNQARALTDIANLHKGEGELGAAELEYKKVLGLWQALGRRRDAAITRTNLAGIYSLAGDPHLALDELAQAAAEVGTSGSPEDRAFILEETGRVHRKLGERDSAIEDYRQALALLRQAGSRENEVAVLDGLAGLHDEAGRYARARELYRAALGLPEAKRDPRWSSALLQDIAWTYLHQGEPAQALPLFRQALPIARKAEFTAGEGTVLLGIARVERGLDHLEAAATWAERSLEAIEALRAGSDRLDQRSALLAKNQDAFDFTVDTLMELDRRHPGRGFDTLAFDVSERARARRLLDALPRTSGEAPQTTLHDARLDTLRRRVNGAEEARLRLLAAGTRGPELLRTDRALRAALEDLRSARDRLAPSRAASNASPRLLRLEDVQTSVLTPETLLLTYDLGPERSYLWAVSTDRVRSFILPASEVLERQARLVSLLLAHSDERATAGQVSLQTERLGERLLGPVAGELARHRRVIASVEGALQTVPLGALPDPGHQGDPLLAHHDVLYVPSASALAWLSARRDSAPPAPPGKLVAVVADPVFERGDDRVKTKEPPGTSPAPEGSPALAGPHLPRLRYSGAEAKAVLAQVPDGEGFLAEGFDARKGLVTGGAVSGFRILHFATHSWASAEEPELSALVLSRVDADGRLQDGILWAHEIAGLHLSAKLVVLSSCDSGLGTAIHGEGLVGLSQAFFRAGVPSLVVSRWRVDDRAAAELMSRFYQGLLGKGLPVAEALRRAQLAIRAEPRWRRPYYWAGFVQEGSW
jgi:CHAT domain-containing protein/Tfp pilus assembly protein PilF